MRPLSPLNGENLLLGIENCLLECYKVDPLSLGPIVEKLSPLIENEACHSTIRSFIEESEKLDLYENQTESDFLPPYHTVLFENDHVRICWAATKSGQQEPPQTHPHKSLMVVVNPAPFFSVLESGETYEDNWPVGVYLLEPSLELLTCKNIGPDEYNGLIFEFK